MLRSTFVAFVATQVLLVLGAVTRFELQNTEQTVVFDCHSKALEEVTLPKEQKIGDIVFDGCVPKTSYADFFSANNITLFKNPTIRIHNLATPLKREHLKDLQLHLFQLKNVTLDNDFLDDTSTIDTLVIDECVLPKLPESVEIKNIGLKNGESAGDFGGCKIQMMDIFKWKIPATSGWLAGCKDLIGLSVNEIKESEVKLVLEGLNSLKLFEALECELTAIPKELNANSNLTQIGLGKNKIEKIGEALKSFNGLQSVLVFEDNLDLEDLMMGLESLKNLMYFNFNYDGCPKSPKVQATANATEVKLGDTVELSCWIESPCLHLLKWHKVPIHLTIPFYWSATTEEGPQTLMASSTRNKLTTYWTVTDKIDTVFICRGHFPGTVKDADKITFKVKADD